MSTSLSGPVLYARQAILPGSASSAVSQPRTPNSPPLLPTRTLPLTTSGAMVIVSPRLMSASCVIHLGRPFSASTEMVRPSSVLKKIEPFAYAAPRLTTSQQATPFAAPSGLGSYCHLIGAPAWLRSNAYRMFGNGVTRYIVRPTTSGAASCPDTIPVEKVHATPSWRTVCALISSSLLNRVDE